MNLHALPELGAAMKTDLSQITAEEWIILRLIIALTATQKMYTNHDVTRTMLWLSKRMSMKLIRSAGVLIHETPRGGML